MEWRAGTEDWPGRHLRWSECCAGYSYRQGRVGRQLPDCRGIGAARGYYGYPQLTQPKYSSAVSYSLGAGQALQRVQAGGGDDWQGGYLCSLPLYLLDKVITTKNIVHLIE